jgi:hypothetical protein
MLSSLAEDIVFIANWQQNTVHAALSTGDFGKGTTYLASKPV